MAETQMQMVEIRKDMAVADIIKIYPDAAKIMLDFGLHCFGCGANVFETLEQGAQGHGFTEQQVDTIVAKINESIKSSGGISIPTEPEIKGPIIELTEAAAKKVKEIMETQGKKGFSLRVRAVPGGCSGYMYGLNFEKLQAPDDTVFEQNGVKILVDSKSAPVLKGIKVDYMETLQQQGFKFDNPNAKSSCGCGESFSA